MKNVIKMNGRFIGFAVNASTGNPSGASSGLKTEDDVLKWAENYIAKNPNVSVLLTEAYVKLGKTEAPVVLSRIVPEDAEVLLSPPVETMSKFPSPGESKSAIYNPEDNPPADHDYTNHMSTRIGDIMNGPVDPKPMSNGYQGLVEGSR